MNVILEIVMELFLDAGFEALGHKKVPKVLRYFLKFLLLGIYLFMGFLLICGGVNLWKQGDGGGFMLIAIGGFLLVFIFLKLRRR